jgi:SAM-dependent methyltransferase
MDIDQVINQLAAIIKDMPEAPQDVESSIGFNQYCRDLWVTSKVKTILSGSSILDIGAGLCPYKKLFDHCNYESQDFKQHGGIDIISDVINIPVDNESFDAILCTEVLEHVVDPIAALKEISRILKLGGKLLLSAPFSCGSHQEPHIYYSGFHPNWYKHFIPKFGLQIIDIASNGGFFKFVAQEIGRVSTKLADETPKSLIKFNNDSMIYLFKTLIPNFLLHFEKESYDPLFSVGYFVEAVKKE